jgi:hypothetical protein
VNYDNIEGVWIPREIWFNADLSLPEKIVFTQIKSLDRTKEGCSAGNSYFGKFMNLSESRISEIIKSLCEKKFVKSKISQFQTTTGIKTQRYLKSCVKLGIVEDPFKIENHANLSLIASSESRSTPSENKIPPSESRSTPSENAQYISISNNKDNSILRQHTDLLWKAWESKTKLKPHFEDKQWKQFKKWMAIATLEDTQRLCEVFKMDTTKEFNAKRIIESFPSPLLWCELINWIRMDKPQPQQQGKVRKETKDFEM